MYLIQKLNRCVRRLLIVQFGLAGAHMHTQTKKINWTIFQGNCVFVRNAGCIDMFPSIFAWFQENWLKRGTNLICQTKHRWNTLCTRMHKSNIFIFEEKNRLNLAADFSILQMCARCCFSFVLFFFLSFFLPHSNGDKFVLNTYLWRLRCFRYCVPCFVFNYCIDFEFLFWPNYTQPVQVWIWGKKCRRVKFMRCNFKIEMARDVRETEIQLYLMED